MDMVEFVRLRARSQYYAWAVLANGIFMLLIAVASLVLMHVSQHQPGPTAVLVALALWRGWRQIANYKHLAEYDSELLKLKLKYLHYRSVFRHWNVLSQAMLLLSAIFYSLATLWAGVALIDGNSLFVGVLNLGLYLGLLLCTAYIGSTTVIEMAQRVTREQVRRYQESMAPYMIRSDDEDS